MTAKMLIRSLECPAILSLDGADVDHEYEVFARIVSLRGLYLKYQASYLS